MTARAALGVAAMLVGATLLLAAGPVVVAAAGVTFGAPSATFTFGKSIDFSQPIAVAGQATRFEILLDYPGSDGPFVAPVATQGAPPAVLHYAIDVATDHVYPNTTIRARWRALLADGSTTVGPSVSVRYEDTRFSWRTLSASIVRVHWYEGPDSFGRHALDIGQGAIEDTSRLLGVTETEPVDFFVYADQEAFYDALGPGTRENVGGQANTDIRTLFALITPNEIDAAWVGVVIPHELTHLVFNTAVANPYHFPPRWLNEGLAVYLSQGLDASDRAAVQSAAGDHSLMPLNGLSGQFPTTRDRFFLAYAESVSAVDFLVRTYSRDALVALVRSYSGGKSDDEAFRGALGVDVAGFQDRWLADVGGAEPRVYGPASAPPGPPPPGWTGLAQAPGSDSGGPTAAPAIPLTGAAGGGLSLVLAGGILAAVILIGGWLLLRGRRRRTSSGP